MKTLTTLLIGIPLVAAAFFLGYQLQQKPTSTPSVALSPGTNSSNSCGPGGCGENSMLHSIAITDEQTFLREMIPHHQEAVDTSRIVLAQTHDPELKQFTQNVITVQTKEMNQMQTWLKQWFNQEKITTNTYLPMMGDLTRYTGTDLEKIYVEGMIRHHQGAVEMARRVLELSPRPEIERLAQDIVVTQQAEVTLLQDWLTTKYQNVEASEEMHHMMNIH